MVDAEDGPAALALDEQLRYRKRQVQSGSAPLVAGVLQTDPADEASLGILVGIERQSATRNDRDVKRHDVDDAARVHGAR